MRKIALMFSILENSEGKSSPPEDRWSTIISTLLHTENFNCRRGLRTVRQLPDQLLGLLPRRYSDVDLDNRNPARFAEGVCHVTLPVIPSVMTIA